VPRRGSVRVERMVRRHERKSEFILHEIEDDRERGKTAKQVVETVKYRQWPPTRRTKWVARRGAKTKKEGLTLRRATAGPASRMNDACRYPAFCSFYSQKRKPNSLKPRMLMQQEEGRRRSSEGYSWRLTIKANQRCRGGAVREGREIQTLIEDDASQRQRPS